MKKIIVMLLLSAAVISCKNSEEKKETDQTTTESTENLQTYKGDFIDTDGAVVLLGSNFIYGVNQNEVSSNLSKQVAAVKENDFDMVGVTVKGTVSKNTNTDNEWEELITIKEIVKVNQNPSEVDIKLEESAKTN
ncbi:hypothetical protein [Aequorivita marina]|uniref:hypothetical protein n=1 Tax=Aequorivita marina TaxID=3073654 RepID=UPI00287573E3|nr:hypothetical protein [Aequorivita sp. S2608]MDS1297342.1 hypothetical protein [Aequorivita sp. S2608]